MFAVQCVGSLCVSVVFDYVPCKAEFFSKIHVVVYASCGQTWTGTDRIPLLKKRQSFVFECVMWNWHFIFPSLPSLIAKSYKVCDT